MALCVLTCSSIADADAVTLLGTRVALQNCTIQAISNAQVFYIDPVGQRQRRSVEEVWAISFDGLPQLDEAEQAITDRDYDTARRKLLEAMVATDSAMQQLWVRNRLLRVHDLRNEYAEACSAFAEIVIADPDPYWARREPKCEAKPTTYAAAHEAVLALKRADRAVKNQALQASIKQMLARLTPIQQALAADYAGPEIKPGSTISGVLRTQIGKWDAVDDASSNTPPEAPPHDAKSRTPSTTAGADDRSAPADATTDAGVPRNAPAPDSADAIDALLKAGSFEAALASCRRVAQRLDDRDLCRFLYQFGESLRQMGHPQDAAIMYMRGAVLFPASTHAGECLVQTALLYRDAFQRPETARRLLERVAVDAERAERPELAERARTLLKDIPIDTP